MGLLVEGMIIGGGVLLGIATVNCVLISVATCITIFSKF
jgi:hypothetical protein